MHSREPTHMPHNCCAIISKNNAENIKTNFAHTVAGKNSKPKLWLKMVTI